MHCLGDCPPADPKRDKKQEQAQQAEDRLKRGKELECPADPQGEDDELVANWTANGEEGEQSAEGKLALLQWTCGREGIARTEQTGQERGRAEEDPVDRAYRRHPAEPWIRDQDSRHADDDHGNACRSQTESCRLQPCHPRDQLPLHWVILPNNLVTSTTLKGSTMGGGGDSQMRCRRPGAQRLPKDDGYWPASCCGYGRRRSHCSGDASCPQASLPEEEPHRLSRWIPSSRRITDGPSA